MIRIALALAACAGLAGCGAVIGVTATAASLAVDGVTTVAGAAVDVAGAGADLMLGD
ncbi:MAG: hypothetical protein ACJA1L_000250 [Paracoccaceae bacterium]|jgi:uncharacterized protein YceK